MQVLRLNEVLARVVAWHNRHPLARRIQATQVHSIGEVLLPFASAQPLVGTPASAPAPAPAPASAPAVAPAPRAGESLADVVSARAAARPTADAAALPRLMVREVSTDEPADPAWATDLDPFAPDPAAGTAPAPASASAAEGGRADETPPADPITDPSTDPSTDQKADPELDAAAAPAAAAAPPTSDSDSSPDAAAAVAVDTAAPDPSVAAVNEAPGIDLTTPLDEPPRFSVASAINAANAASADKAVDTPEPGVEPPSPGIDLTSPSAPTPAAKLTAPAWPAEAPVGWLRRLAAHLTGRRPGWPRLEAAFSRDFIWPLTPKEVARWAQRHGQAQSMAPADWPRRQVAANLARLGQLRQAGLPHTVQLHLLTAAIGVGDRRIRVLMDGDGRIIGPRAYSRARSTSAAVLLLAGLLAAGWQWGVLRPPDDDDEVARVAQVAQAASAASAISAISAASTATGASAASAASAAAVVALAASTASAPATALTASSTTPPIIAAITAPITASTPPPKPAADAPPLGRIRPALSDDERRIAKQQAARLREAPGPAPAAAGATPNRAPPATVYAVVTRPSRQREAAASGLVVMRSARARLSPPVPYQTELMQNQGQWRAAWWPFASQMDAERARKMLAARGLKAEVVEF